MRLLLWSLFTLSLLPFFAYEAIRFFTHHGECTIRFAQNRLLLENVLCSDPWQTTAHGPKQQAACDKALAENQVSILSCAWQEMWLKGELNRIWSTITSNVWTLFAFIMPLVMLVIGLLFSTWNERSARRDMMNMQKEMYRETLQSVHASPPSYLQQGDYDFIEPMPVATKRKRANGNYIQLIRQE